MSGWNIHVFEFFFKVVAIPQMVLCVANYGQKNAAHLLCKTAKDGVASRHYGAHRKAFLMDFGIAKV